MSDVTEALANSRAYFQVELEGLDEAAAVAGGTLEWQCGYVGRDSAELCGYLRLARTGRSGHERSARFYVELRRAVGAGNEASLRVGGYTRRRFASYGVGEAKAVFRRRVQAFERRIGLRVVNRPRFKELRKMAAPGHSRSCAVVALAAVAGCTVEDAHAFWELYGARKSRHEGTLTLAGLHNADPRGCHGHREGCFELELLRIRLVPIAGVHQMTAARFVKEWGNRSRRVFFHTAGHASSMVDGVVIDTGALRPMSRVQNAWAVFDLDDKCNASEVQDA